MKKVMMTIGLLVTSAVNANAQSKVEFVSNDDSVESAICIAAGKYGLAEAREVIKENRLDFHQVSMSLSCNGMSLAKFARQYSELSQRDDNKMAESRSIVLVAQPNNRTASLCVDAIIIGEQAAREKYDVPKDPITCNNKPLSKFVATYAMATIISSDDQLSNEE